MGKFRISHDREVSLIAPALGHEPYLLFELPKGF